MRNSTEQLENEASPEFAAAVQQLLKSSWRNDLQVKDIASPAGLAPEAFALSADVRPPEHGIDSPYGTGRFLLLYDPEEPDAWGGPWRIISFAQAPIESEIGSDPLLIEVVWSWLMDALDQRNAKFSHASGTVTKTNSKGFGSIAEEGEGAQIELRASWSPYGDFANQLSAWAELLCMLAGLPPGSENLTLIGEGRRK